jgi:hypothetical protein
MRQQQPSGLLVSEGDDVSACRRFWSTFAVVPLTAAVLAGCWLLAGCGETDQSARLPTNSGLSNPYAAEFADLRKEAKSDFVRSVLRDDVITQAEFDESIDSRFKCMTDAGLRPIIDGEGANRTLGIPAGEEDSPENDACYEKWDAGIQGLYTLIHNNPENISWDDLAVACLIHEGLLPVGTTGEELAEVMDRGGTQVQMLENGEFATLRQPIDPDPAFPNGFRPLSEDGNGCMVDPRATLLGSGGQLPTKQPAIGQGN